MLVNIYLLILSLFKLLIVYKLIRGNTFYFVFWRASAFFSTFLLLIALIVNLVFSIHIFNNNISNFLFPTIDFIYFLIFSIIIILFLGKYIPSITNSYFNSITNFLLFISLFYSLITLFFFMIGSQISLTEIFFPFGQLVKGVWVIGPLFGAFYWSKLTNNQKKIVILSIIMLILLNIINGRRSFLLFIIFFITFWCWRTKFLKKLSIMFVLFLIYIPFHGYHLVLKHLTNKNLNISDKIELFFQSDIHHHTSHMLTNSFLDTSVKRILHAHIITEPVYEEIKTRKGVGIQPFLTAIYAPIPSKFLNNKPYPGSLDGNKYTSFEHQVNYIAFNNIYDMSGYLVSLKWIWYGNHLMSFLSVIITISVMIFHYRTAIFFGDRLVIIPLLCVFPGDYDYFLPEFIKLVTMFSYVFLPAVIFLFFFKSLKTFLIYVGNKNISSKTRLVQK